jgi:hypothetical protein
MGNLALRTKINMMPLRDKVFTRKKPPRIANTKKKWQKVFNTKSEPKNLYDQAKA